MLRKTLSTWLRVVQTRSSPLSQGASRFVHVECLFFDGGWAPFLVSHLCMIVPNLSPRLKFNYEIFGKELRALKHVNETKLQPPTHTHRRNRFWKVPSTNEELRVPTTAESVAEIPSKLVPKRVHFSSSQRGGTKREW